MEHYFTKDSSVDHNIKEMNYEINDERFTFLTDNAVFSKKRVDFGSEVLLKAILSEEISPGSILDVGCGYGPIGIILAKFFSEAAVTMADVNNRALELCEKNAQKNELKNIKIVNSNIYENISEKYDVIVTNPPIRAGKDIVHGIIEGAKERLNDNGILYAVIQKKQGAESAKKKMHEGYGNCEIIEKSAGFWILKSVKRD